MREIKCPALDAERILDDVCACGFETDPAQVWELHAVAFPILKLSGFGWGADSAYAECLDRVRVITIPEVEAGLGIAAWAVSELIADFPQA